ncbi:MAG: hypothetical protein CSA82_01375 [Actinobacteria bacterium]|nr:MAG: hypothetical protein CSA82_01375 [Actinomycetota bacterium]
MCSLTELRMVEDVVVKKNGTAAASQLWLSADKTYTKSYMMYDTILAYDGETVKSFVEYSLNG